MDRQKLQDFLGAVAVSFTLVMAGCIFFQPRWETNDDIAMSMVAHGYGIAAFESPNLIFSNVIWGYIVRSIPDIKGALGYSVATLAVLLFFGIAMIYALRRLRFSWLISIAALCLVLARPLLFPQFTVNAGLITLGAVICWYLYSSRQEGKLLLWIGCLLACVGFLIRSQEFLLVLLIGLPFLYSRTLFKDRSVIMAGVFLVIALGGAQFVDWQAYQGEEWQDFKAINYARAPYTDFGADALLLSRPDVYANYGYSENDVRLITSWGVYADPQLAEPEKLVSMLADMGFVPDRTMAFDNVITGVKALLHPSLLPFCIALFCLGFHPRLGWALGLFVLAVMAMSIAGRPGVIRVYYPLVMTLLVLGMLSSPLKEWSSSRVRIFYSALLAALSLNAWWVIKESVAVNATDQAIRSEMHHFPTTSVTTWGPKFPYLSAYPVLHIPERSFDYTLHGFGVFCPAPFSVASQENASGHGIKQRLASEHGLRIVASDDQIQVLGHYCRERLHGSLQTVKEETYGPVILRRIRCQM